MGDQIEELYTDVLGLLAELGADVDTAITDMAGAQREAAGEDLEAVADAVALTEAAAKEIGIALQRYKRAVAPMAEPERGSSRMFK